jgi:hypothetical protein
MTQAPPPAAGVQVKNHPLAIWSLVCGIASLVCCGLLAGIPAIILAGMAKNKIAESAGAWGGESLAKIGGILGWISIALTIIGIIVWVLFFAAAMHGNLNVQ